MTQIYKRGDTWTVRFSRRRKVWNAESNKWESKLKQVSKGGFKTKTQAKRYSIKMESEALDGVDVIDNPIFCEYFNKYVDTVKAEGAKPATLRKHKYYKGLVANMFGQMRIKDITRQRYQAIVNTFGKDHAPVTVRQVNSMIRSCVAYAREDGLLNKDFTYNVRLGGNKENTRVVKYLSGKQLKALLKWAKQTTDPRYTARYMIILCIGSGARLGEISGLHWDDIDFDKCTIDINKSWNQAHKEMGPPKNANSYRVIQVPRKILYFLKPLRNNHKDFVFGEPISNYPPTSNGINKVLRDGLKAIGVEDLSYHFHSLRHSHVAYLMFSGVDIYAISKRLGHANISITLDTYAHMIEEFKEKENKIIHDSLEKLNY